MFDVQGGISCPPNEPVFDYQAGGVEREGLKKALDTWSHHKAEIPLIIGGREVRTGRLGEVRCPHDHGRLLATYHQAGPEEVAKAAQAAEKAWKAWACTPASSRLAVFRKAAELLAGKYRFSLVAATMLNQSKTAHQSEIEAACELIDFLRFNTYFVELLTRLHPISGTAELNFLDLRPLEGFVLAVSPFNFTAIGGNLPTAPAMMGNACLWKPASSVVFSNYQLMRLWQEAGLPDGVINFIPGPAAELGKAALSLPSLAGVHFTGSTATFRWIWTELSQNLENYRTYPRLVGETGGKNFVVVHASADLEATATGLIRGAFEYQGQKCSAASRAYVPDTLWPKLRERLVEETKTIKVGDISDFSNFMGAVIDSAAFERITGYLRLAADSNDCTIISGGQGNDSVGYFVEPTLIETTHPHHRLMEEEIFGPVLTIYIYPEGEFEETLLLCDQTSPYGLTGSVFGTDRKAIDLALEKLRFAAGNFYINDKPTGAVVGRQPFGGGRASGTNDKAGSVFNLLRWTNPRAVKENLLPPRDYRYPFMDQEH
jgi:1-pyrroline-5-carboxylate dehydrogenase